MNNTPTPRTEAARIENADLYDEGHGLSEMVPAGFARQLEREVMLHRGNRQNALDDLDKVNEENITLRTALKNLTVRFAKVESLYFDLAIRVGTTVSPDCDVEEQANAMRLLSKYERSTT